MADKSIAELQVSQQMTDDALLVVYQGGETAAIEGRSIKGYAREGAEQYVEGAAKDAQAAAKSAASAKEDAKAAQASAKTAEQYSGKPPQIKGGTWWIWDAAAGKYKDTKSPAQGNLLYATFFVDPSTGELYMVIPEEYRGPSFALVDGNLEVTV